MSLKFISNKVCPFAHRVWITLLETPGLEFEFKVRVNREKFYQLAHDSRRHINSFASLLLEIIVVAQETSLSQKPAWFTEIYRQAVGADSDADGAVRVCCFILAIDFFEFTHCLKFHSSHFHHKLIEAWFE